MRSFLIATAVAAAVSGSANGGVQIWSGDPNNVVITGQNVTIGSAGTYKFKSVTAGNLDVIGNITIADGVTGTVVVHIERNSGDPNDPNGAPGLPAATSVGSIVLTNNVGVTGNLAGLKINGELGTSAASTVRNVTGDCTADTVTKSITINRDLVSGATLDVGAMTGSITITRFCSGHIVAASLNGNITLNNDMTSSASISINSTYAGVITSNAVVDGTINIGDDPNLEHLDTSGRIRFKGTAASSGLSGTVNIAGDLRGRIRFSVAASDFFDGKIDVHRDITSTGRIEIVDQLDAGA